MGHKRKWWRRIKFGPPPLFQGTVRKSMLPLSVKSAGLMQVWLQALMQARSVSTSVHRTASVEPPSAPSTPVRREREADNCEGCSQSVCLRVLLCVLLIWGLCVLDASVTAPAEPAAVSHGQCLQPPAFATPSTLLQYCINRLQDDKYCCYTKKGDGPPGRGRPSSKCGQCLVCKDPKSKQKCLSPLGTASVANVVSNAQIVSLPLIQAT